MPYGACVWQETQSGVAVLVRTVPRLPPDFAAIEIPRGGLPIPTRIRLVCCAANRCSGQRQHHGGARQRKTNPQSPGFHAVTLRLPSG